MGCGLLNVLCLKCMGVCYGLLSVLWFAQCAMAYSMCVLCGMYVMSCVHGLTQLWGYVVHMHGDTSTSTLPACLKWGGASQP